MAFRDELVKVCEGVEGGVLCTLMSFDGIPVDTFEREEAAARLNVQTLLGEITNAANQLNLALKAGGFERAGEVTVSLRECAVVIRQITDEYFVALALEEGGNFGKARYLLRTIAPVLQEQL